MTRGSDVLAMLRPNGGWIMRDNDFNQIEWVDCEPLTKAEFEAGFAKYDAFIAKQEADALTAKESAQAKLAALGLTTDDLKALGL
jgi:hypothetical protein